MEAVSERTVSMTTKSSNFLYPAITLFGLGLVRKGLLW